jgi:cation transporter-like permease
MSAFAFDAPGSAQDPAVWQGVGLVLAYPLLPVLGVPASFVAYWRRHRNLAYILLGIAALPLLVIVVGLAAVFAVNVLFSLGVKL